MSNKHKRVLSSKLTPVELGQQALQNMVSFALGKYNKSTILTAKKSVTWIVEAAREKVQNKNAKVAPDLRVADSVFRSGGFIQDKMVAEYFGGVLASSCNDGGKDDSLIPYLVIVQSLASTQMKLHYLLYRALNHLMVESDAKSSLNLRLQNNLRQLEMFFLAAELNQFGINLDTDFAALHNQGLIRQYSYGSKPLRDEISYSSITPTTLGFQLYSVASGNIRNWHDVSSRLLEGFGALHTLELKFRTFDQAP